MVPTWEGKKGQREIQNTQVVEVFWFVWFVINAIRVPFISKSPERLLTFSFKDKLDYITYLYYVHCIISFKNASEYKNNIVFKISVVLSIADSSLDY